MPVIRRSLSKPIPEPAVQQPLDKRAYNVHEAAKYLGVSKWQTRKWVSEGVLKSASISKAANAKQLFDKAELDRFLDQLFGKVA